MPKTLTPPLSRDDVAGLRAGEQVLVTGTVYTARDAAHRRLLDLVGEGGEPPFDLEGAVIYYTGPTPACHGRPVGAAGPTTSSRMDRFTPDLLARGVRAMIGKGDRGDEVARALAEHGAVYLAAVGGAGALLGKCIVAAEVVAYPELGPEAIHRFEVRELPAVVAIDARGGNIYAEGRERFRRR